MKKLLFFSLFISFKIFGQSVLVTPGAINKQNSVLDDITIQSFATYPSIIGLRANNTIASPTALASDDIIFQIGIRGYTGVGFSSSRANIRFKATQNWTNTANGTSITFETTPNNSIIRTERMIINQDGYVGIGMSSPSDKLTVQTATNNYGVSHTDGTVTVSTYLGGAGGWFGTKSAHPLYFYTSGGSPRMTLSTVGNIGIGTTTPNAPLQFSNAAVNRKVVLYDATNNDHQYYGFGINGGTLRYQIDVPTSNHVFFAGASTSTSTELMRIQGNGNVGIGLSNPNASLAVNRGTGTDGTAAFFGTTHTSHFNYSTDETTYIRGGKNNAKVLINDLVGLGNVGIGTSLPNYKLQVNTIGNGAGIVHANNAGIQVGTYAGFGAGWYGTMSNHPLVFFVNNGNAAVTLTTSEQLQVGGATTPAGYKMSVDGKVICTELEVLVTPWPDYVFKPNYKLKPLQEIEIFIAKNGHLPNIPKAEDIENKSLAVGNMAKLQMEKIEELTLYLIEINKRLEKVEHENVVLRAELKSIKSQN